MTGLIVLIAVVAVVAYGVTAIVAHIERTSS